jgi:hypothetical protein
MPADKRRRGHFWIAPENRRCAVPLDVIGGVGLGLAVAGGVHLLVAIIAHAQQRSRS